MRALPTLLLAALVLTGSTAEAGGKAVLFDEGHGQRFLIGREESLDLSGLAAAFTRAGGEPRSLRGPLTDAVLAGAGSLVISGPFQPLSPEEVAAVGRFLQGGGRLAVMLHIPHTATGLLQFLDVAYSRGVVQEEENLTGTSRQDFFITRMEPHPLTEGIERFGAYGAWAVKNNGPHAYVIARTGPRAWLDLNSDKAYSPGDPVESFGIVVQGTHGQGRFVVFGDDAIFQNRFLQGGNLSLADNLARWLLAETR